MASNMEMAKKNGKMVHFIKEIISMARRKDMENLNGMTGPLIRANSLKIIFMEKAYINGQTADSITGTGSAE